MKVEKFWDGIKLGDNHRNAVLEMKFDKQECECLYRLYKKNHNVFFEEVLKKEKSEKRNKVVLKVKGNKGGNIDVKRRL